MGAKLPTENLAPDAVRWFGAVLREIPGPTDGWAEIVSSAWWPLLILLLAFWFRRHLQSILATLAERMRTDNVRFGIFELTSNADVIVLDPADAGESTDVFDPADIHRIERMFEFISATDDGLERLQDWLNQSGAETLDVVELLELPIYAPLRERAFAEVEGLSE